MRGVDVESSSDTASLSRQPASVGCESPETMRTSLPALQEEALRGGVSKAEIHEQCCKCLVQWKTAMLVQQLSKMGFEMWKAIAAVHIFGNDVEGALHWLVENGGICQSQITAILQLHPAAEICIEFELRTMMHACHHAQIEDVLLERAVIQFEGDLTSAISSLFGNHASDHMFPDSDLSLGIVHSESPIHYDAVAHRINRRSVDAISNDLMLGCVLGNALDEYKRGHADFTDVANKGLGYYEKMHSASSSPLSQSLSSHSAFHEHVQRLYGSPQGNPESTTELRHFIGDLLE